MCGFAGIFDPSAARSGEELSGAVLAMAGTLLHRGPDDGGCWVDAAAGVGLGSRRLAVIDLSLEGHQPMSSASGRFVLAYNGEVYNFIDLRKQLERSGVSFRGESDTEVLVEAIEAWGVERALREANGMFAFAAWDRANRVLCLARDRLGEKPLYYGWSRSSLLFGSELKALRAAPGFSPGVDRTALARFLELGRVPAPMSIYEGVSQLPPGAFVELGPDEVTSRRAEVKRYWSAYDAASQTGNHQTPAEVVEQLEHLLADSVAMRLHADVPLGVFLSGGIDSSTVAALMQARSSAPVRSFTIGFDDPAYDESGAAAAVARHLGTDHTELRVTASEAIEVIGRLPEVYDEPFADASQIPTYLVSRLARRDVTVALSGDGGDELFGGYNRHVYAGRVVNSSRHVPAQLRRSAAGLLRAVPTSTWDRLYTGVERFLPARARHRLPGIKVQKLAGILPAETPGQAYAVLASTWPEAARLVRGVSELAPHDFGPVPEELRDAASQMMYLDLVNYLPDDILVKLDRASMAVSLESRVPLLDHRVVELAWRIPVEQKIRNGVGKWILRQVLARYVPIELVDRPKAGFGLPIGAWLRGPLRDWAEELLQPSRLAAEGYLEPDPVARCWREHLSGRHELEAQLWPVLMFQSWRAAYRA